MEEEIQFSHTPVLLRECMEALAIRPDGTYVDGTLGGAGHACAIAERLGEGGRLLGLDQDGDAIRAASARLAPYGSRVTVVRCNFRELTRVCREQGLSAIDGLLLDLGVSSHQLTEGSRGFAYQKDAPLDMRMDQRSALTAEMVVNEYSEDALRRVLFDYGEERYSGRIASAIVSARRKQPIRTTGELVRIIKGALPASAREGGHHPAKRTFQALRIEVNGELDVLEPTLRAAAGLLRPGGRIAVISFHSLEDRIVKRTFADLALGCTCPKRLPVCVCGRHPQMRVITRKPILPSAEEIKSNPRARSAKLRVAEKLEE